MGAKDVLNPDFQVGDGCLVDQLVGQYMATLAGLGDLLDSSHIRKTLASIYKYNYKPDLRDHASVQRVYALNSEAALILCDFTVGTRPQVPMPYYAENFTGLEYTAATLMMANGMVKEGVECIASIRRRYDGERANPFDETEYGRHYARAMASWAPIPILSGFRWDGRRQTSSSRRKVEAKPFDCLGSTPTARGRGTYTAQRRQRQARSHNRQHLLEGAGHRPGISADRRPQAGGYFRWESRCLLHGWPWQSNRGPVCRLPTSSIIGAGPAA